EQEIVVVFADLRGFTRMAEKRLPYDVVYLLNRYFEAVGSAIERAGGIANQFTGDGVMALFGVESGPEAGCRQALAAARGMIAGVDSLSRELGGDLPQPLRLGIGIHVGHAVVGRMGYGDSTYFTAVGDTVHVAARLEQATKDYACELVISDDVVTRAGLDAAAFPRHEVARRVHHPLDAVGVRPRRQLARGRQDEARALAHRVDAAAHLGLDLRLRRPLEDRHVHVADGHHTALVAERHQLVELVDLQPGI